MRMRKMNCITAIFISADCLTVFEAYDVQETRRISREEGREERLVELVCKKIAKNYSVSDIAEIFGLMERSRE